jgi:hypothetical protein
VVSRFLTPSEAVAALRRGAHVEQFLSLAEGRLRYLTAGPRKGRFTLSVHEVWDDGGEDFADISEFGPVDEDEYVGVGRDVATEDDPEQVVRLASAYGGSPDAWDNHGMASSRYLAAKADR